MNIEIQNAAQVVVQARQALQAAAADLAKAEEERSMVARRVSALEDERANIVADRKAGKDAPDHGARLALIAADFETLSEVMARREGDIAPLRIANDEARRLLAAAEHKLSQAEAAELQRRLVAHADKLDSLLLQTLADLDQATKRLGEARPAWVPSKGLALLFQKLDLQRATVARPQ